jgi:light-dependent protochlorophyllide reductase
MARKSVLITGGNSGIGVEAARCLARDGWHVVIASRNREASAEAVRRINAESGACAASERGLDLGSLASVRQFVEEVAADDLRLQALVCNAGLQMNRLAHSPEGHELTFAVNHLGHFLLTNLLLTRLSALGPARIVIVASGVHDPKMRTGMPKAAVTDVRTLAATGGPRPGEFNGRLAYVNSKLCNLWFTYELGRRIEAAGLATGEHCISVNAYEPGLVPGSGLARDYPAWMRFIWGRVLPGLATVLSPVVAGINPAPKSGQALARVVVDPSLANISGKYFPSHTRWREAPSSDWSYDLDRARALWDESVALSGLRPGESPLLPAGAR